MKKIQFSLLAAALSAGILFAAKNHPPAPPADGFGTVPDEKAPELTAAKSNTNLTAENVETSKADESVFLASDGKSYSIKKSTLSKNGGDSSNDGQSNFYGLNGGLVAQNASSVSLENVTVKTDADGANAVFSTGENSKITAKNLTIRTEKDSSRGLDATYGGFISAEKVDVLTKGAHCAAFATDRGEGTVIVKGGKAETNGEGSPVIYSTGDIRLSNLTGKANGAQIACIEGKNSILVEKSKIEGGISAKRDEVNSAVMLYQSMSGDANLGTATFTAKNSTLKNKSDGPFFYVTNTQAEINLVSTKLTGKTDELLRAAGNNSSRGWGRSGANGGKVVLNAEKQTLTGSINADSISSIEVNLKDGTKFTGSINKGKTEGSVSLNLAKKASVTLDGNCYIDAFSDEDEKLTNIKSGGHIIYYNKDNEKNSWLSGKTYTLNGGGKLAPTSYETAKTTSNESDKKSDRAEMGGFKGDFKNGEGGPMTRMQTFEGKLTYSSVTSQFTLTTGDGKTYAVTLFSPGKPDKMGGRPDMGGQPPADMGNPPSGGMRGFGGGNPPEMGNGNRPDKKEPPKMLSDSDLKKLADKNVILKGELLTSEQAALKGIKVLSIGDGVIVAFAAEEK